MSLPCCCAPLDCCWHEGSDTAADLIVLMTEWKPPIWGFVLQKSDSSDGAAAHPESAETLMLTRLLLCCLCCVISSSQRCVIVLTLTCVCVSHTGGHHCSSCLRTTAQSGCCVTFVPAHCIITCFWYYVTYRISIAALATLWPHAASLACYFWNLLAGHARPPLSRPGSGFM